MSPAIYIPLGLFYGTAFIATVYSLTSDIIAARQQMRRARVQRPVIALAQMRVVK